MIDMVSSRAEMSPARNGRINSYIAGGKRDHVHIAILSSGAASREFVRVTSCSASWEATTLAIAVAMPLAADTGVTMRRDSDLHMVAVYIGAEYVFRFTDQISDRDLSWFFFGSRHIAPLGK